MRKVLLIIVAVPSYIAIYVFVTAFFVSRIELTASSCCEDKPYSHPFASAAPGSSLLDEGLGLGLHVTLLDELLRYLPFVSIDDSRDSSRQHIKNNDNQSDAIYRHIQTIIKDHESRIEEAGERDNCWGFSSLHGRKLTPRRKIFLFVIDALRIDMLKVHDEPADPTYNQFKYVRQLLLHNSSQTQLFTFTADSPTTTSQRLKGITTGSFPTFIDFSGNFNANNSLLEDNFVDQLSASGRHLVFLGDDTWSALFPHQFDVSLPFGSFDTVNLHGVDNSIKENIWGYLGSNSSGGSDGDEWDVFIVHFLGVDHVGHTHNAFHAHMAEKFREMDALLERVIEALPPDSLLFLFGDHGMTDGGEHGGDSDAEVDAGLFVYSTTPVYACQSPTTREILTSACGEEHWKRSWSSENKSFVFDKSAAQLAREPRRIDQVDLAATLALLTDSPIPFSSIGALIPELVAPHIEEGDGVDVNMRLLLHNLFLNAMQVRRFIYEYRKAGIVGAGLLMTPAEYCEINQLLLAALEAHAELSTLSLPSQGLGDSALRRYFEYLGAVKSATRKSWNTFDLGGMMIGAYSLQLLFLATGCLLAAKIGPAGRALSSLAHEQPVAAMYCSMSLLFALLYPLGAFSDTMIRAEAQLVFAYTFLITLVAAVYCCVTRVHIFPSLEDSCSAAYKVLLVLLALLLSLLRASSDEAFATEVVGERAPRVLHYLLLLEPLYRCLYSYTLGCSDFVWYLLVIVLSTESIGNNAIVLSAAVPLALHLSAMRGKGLKEAPPPLMGAAVGVNTMALSRSVYFLTSHSFSFSSLKVSVAFTGSSTFNFFYGGLMLFINTFGVEIVAALALVTACQQWRGGGKAGSIYSTPLVACLWFKLYIATCCVVCTLVLRKHLMVFAIFAPKLIFELCFYLAVSTVILLSNLSI